MARSERPGPRAAATCETPSESELCPAPPDTELDVLELAFQVAVAMAGRKSAGEGYTALFVGLLRARELRAEGEPWGETLVCCWQQACDRYAYQFGVARE